MYAHCLVNLQKHIEFRLISCTNTELWLCDGFGNVKPLRQGFDKYAQQNVIHVQQNAEEYV